MPSLINRIPAGLSDILGIKATGRSPFTLLDEVRGGVDLTVFYLAGQERGYTANAGFAAVGSNNTITVPAGANWLMTDLTILATVPAGEVLRAGCRIEGTYRRTDGTTQILALMVVASKELTAGAGSETFSAMMDRDGPVVLRPADKLVLVCEKITTATSITVTAFARFYELPI